MLQISAIRKRYGDNLILDDISFIVNSGERIGLIGPNGCGKTTLLRIITGEEEPDAGSVQLDPPDLRVGWLEQGLTYAAGKTVGEVLRAGERELEAAAAHVAELAEALAGAADSTQPRLLAAYDQALSRLEELIAAQPAEHEWDPARVLPKARRPSSINLSPGRTRVGAHEAEAVLAGLDLSGLDLQTPVATLSGGQKTRLGLACLLLARPQRCSSPSMTVTLSGSLPSACGPWKGARSGIIRIWTIGGGSVIREAGHGA